MPRVAVTRQSPIPKAKPNGKVEVPENDAWGMSEGMTATIYGESGSGKTTLASTFPGPVLWLVCSGGKRPGELRSIDTPENRSKIRAVVIDDVATMEMELASADGYATVVLDHATGLSDLMIKELLGLDSIPVSKSRKAAKGESWSLVSQQQYGQLAVQLKEMFRDMIDSDGNVVFLAQQRINGGDQGQSSESSEILRPWVGPALTPSVAGWLAPACDYVVQTFKRPRMKKVIRKVGTMNVETMERVPGVEYCLRTGPHDEFLTKFRRPRSWKDGVEVELPELIVDPSYDKIQSIIKGQ